MPLSAAQKVKIEQKKQRAVWPFNQVDYVAICPNGHEFELWTGYSVYAPDSWKQHGGCDECNTAYHRLVVKRGDRFKYSKFKIGLDCVGEDYEFE